MYKTKVAIFSLEADLHAHAVQAAVNERKDASCEFFAVDAQVDSGGVLWSCDPDIHQMLRSYEGEWTDLSRFDVVWWRRVNQPQKPENLTGEPDVDGLINNEWKATLAGAAAASFSGAWVNEPNADILAGNKLYQLRAAAKLGLRVPATIVSADPDAVLNFCERHGGRVVLKKVIGAAGMSLATVPVSSSDLASAAESIRQCPAMYQEVIEGGRHIRANCFGGDVHSVLITSDILDWRRDLASAKFSPYELDIAVREQLAALLELLGLRMGIMDLILTHEGELVWLELNPQGQFLFCEALANVDLLGPFASFLVDQAH